MGGRRSILKWYSHTIGNMTGSSDDRAEQKVADIYKDSEDLKDEFWKNAIKIPSG